jgi:hypothetical protein
MSIDENAPAAQIPNSLQIQRARTAIRAAPPDATADHFDQIIRKTALVTTPVRKILAELRESIYGSPSCRPQP